MISLHLQKRIDMENSRATETEDAASIALLHERATQGTAYDDDNDEFEDTGSREVYQYEVALGDDVDDADDDDADDDDDHADEKIGNDTESDDNGAAADDVDIDGDISFLDEPLLNFDDEESPCDIDSTCMNVLQIITLFYQVHLEWIQMKVHVALM